MSLVLGKDERQLVLVGWGWWCIRGRLWDGMQKPLTEIPPMAVTVLSLLRSESNATTAFSKLIPVSRRVPIELNNSLVSFKNTVVIVFRTRL